MSSVEMAWPRVFAAPRAGRLAECSTRRHQAPLRKSLRGEFSFLRSSYISPYPWLNYGRRPPPPERAAPPPPREAPVLEAPRALLAWALALFEAPPKALVFRDALLLGTCRLPILFPPLLTRFAPALLALVPAFVPARFPAPFPRFALALLGAAPAFAPARFPVPLLRFAPMLFGLTPALAPARFPAVAPRLFVPGCCLLFDPCCCRAFACRVDIESPRAVPPYLLATCLFE